MLVNRMNGVYTVKQKTIKEIENENEGSFFEQLDLMDFRDDLRYK